MKKAFLFGTVVLCAISFVSCNNSNRSSDDEIDGLFVEDGVSAAKLVLAENILVALDELGEELKNETQNDLRTVWKEGLTDEQKLVRPDYLLEPSRVDDFLTHRQKVYALAVYLTEISIREAYDMPVDDAKASIGKLMGELDHPVDYKDYENLSVSESIAKTYQLCKDKGVANYFWNFEFALQNSFLFLVSKNVDLVFNNLTDVNFNNLCARLKTTYKSAKILAEYDQEIADALSVSKIGEFLEALDAVANRDGIVSVESAKTNFVEWSAAFEESRNALLK